MIHAEVLFHIADTLEARKSADPKSSYVSELLHKGEDAVLKKVAEEAAEVPTVAGSLDEALSALDADREFLTRGGVFSDDFINSYLELKQQDVDRVRMTPHPLEFELYYSV